MTKISPLKVTLIALASAAAGYLAAGGFVALGLKLAGIS